jgi:hypothetical protein
MLGSHKRKMANEARLYKDGIEISGVRAGEAARRRSRYDKIAVE